jgi:hypothetical protein
VPIAVLHHHLPSNFFPIAADFFLNQAITGAI